MGAKSSLGRRSRSPFPSRPRGPFSQRAYRLSLSEKEKAALAERFLPSVLRAFSRRTTRPQAGAQVPRPRSANESRGLMLPDGTFCRP